MADDSPVGSPLSELSSDAFDGEDEHEMMAAAMPPAKRQKLGDSSARATPVPRIEDDAASISSDSSGDVPSSPSNQPPSSDDNHDQVTVCVWGDCDAGDLGNMDNLIHHIQNEHIETRTKKYTCEWKDCDSQGRPHASAYALKSHLRKHTHEKPFHCDLPECDRAFTRSDALMKHMRTVHETEPLRPSDPIPKSMHPSVKSNRLKLIVKAGSPNEGHTPSNGVANGAETSGWTSAYPENLYFTAEEEARGPHELYRLLRRQIIWAGEEGELLKKQCEAMEELRHKEWLEKEVLLDQVISNEIDWHQRRQEVLAGMAQLPSIDAIRAAATGAAPQISQESAIASSPPAIPTLAQKIEEREASSVLASMNPVN